MLKNRFLMLLGGLCLSLVAMAISYPLSKPPTTTERGRAAEAARWKAMGEYYGKLEESPIGRSRAAEAARWTAMAEYYRDRAEALHHFEIIEQHGEALLEAPDPWIRLEVIEQHGEALAR